MALSQLFAGMGKGLEGIPTAYSSDRKRLLIEAFKLLGQESATPVRKNPIRKSDLLPILLTALGAGALGAKPGEIGQGLLGFAGTRQAVSDQDYQDQMAKIQEANRARGVRGQGLLALSDLAGDNEKTFRDALRQNLMRSEGIRERDFKATESQKDREFTLQRETAVGGRQIALEQEREKGRVRRDKGRALLDLESKFPVTISRTGDIQGSLSQQQKDALRLHAERLEEIYELPSGTLTSLADTIPIGQTMKGKESAGKLRLMDAQAKKYLEDSKLPAARIREIEVKIANLPAVMQAQAAALRALAEQRKRGESGGGNQERLGLNDYEDGLRAELDDLAPEVSGVRMAPDSKSEDGLRYKAILDELRWITAQRKENVAATSLRKRYEEAIRRQPELRNELIQEFEAQARSKW